MTEATSKAAPAFRRPHDAERVLTMAHNGRGSEMIASALNMKISTVKQILRDAEMPCYPVEDAEAAANRERMYKRRAVEEHQEMKRIKREQI